MEKSAATSKRFDILAVSTMALLTVGGAMFLFITGATYAALGICAGILFFFFHKAYSGTPAIDTGITFQNFIPGLKIPTVWLSVAISCIFEVAFVLSSHSIAPDYITHELTRIQGMVDMETGTPLLLLQLLILALGEEMAWRGFFQKRLDRHIGFIPSLLVTTCFFTIGHLSRGDAGTIAYGMLEVIVQSIIYGMIFKRTNNIYIAAICHFLANAIAFIVIFWIPKR